MSNVENKLYQNTYKTIANLNRYGSFKFNKIKNQVDFFNNKDASSSTTSFNTCYAQPRPSIKRPISLNPDNVNNFKVYFISNLKFLMKYL